MRVALTGASGLVGSYTAAALARAGHSVRALVRRTSRRDAIASFVDEWREGSYDDPQTAAGLVAGVDVLIHNAVDWDALRRSAGTHYQKNVLGSLNLLEAARLAGVEQVIFVSSVAVYGTIFNAPNPALDETVPAWPDTLYGAYKASVESFLLAYHKEHGMNTSAWRPAAIYGVHVPLDRSKWYELIKTARDGGRIATDKGGKIVHVRDVADALTAAVGDGEVAGKLFNLVDQYLYWQRVAEFARELSGSSAAIEPMAGSGPKNQFDCRAAKAFFDRHGKMDALRRGESGVRDYVQALLKEMA